jgi:hypothetical protein
MRLAYVIILFVSILSACDTESSFPIPEDNYFVKFYGNEGEQEGVDFILNTDGSVVMVGNSKTFNDQQLIYAVKVDAQGAVLWQHYYGTSLPGDKTAKDIELHSDGRIMVVGEFVNGTNDSDIYLFSLNADGVLQDSVTVGLVDNNGVKTDEHANSLTIISDGFIVAGSTTLENFFISTVRNAMHLRFDNSLNEIPQTGTVTWGPRNYGENYDDVAVKVLELTPGANSFYVFGYSNQPYQQYTGDFNYWYYSLSGDGVPSDGPFYAGKTSEDELLKAVEISPVQSGPGYILSGTATRTTGETQSYLVKLAPSTLSFTTTDIRIETNPTDMGNNVSGSISTKNLLSQEFMLLTNDNTVSNVDMNLALTKLTPVTV